VLNAHHLEQLLKQTDKKNVTQWKAPESKDHSAELNTDAVLNADHLGQLLKNVDSEKSEKIVAKKVETATVE